MPVENVSPLRVLLKALGLFAVASLALALTDPTPLGRLSLYNHLFPGRERLPFGEDHQHAYNLSMYGLDAMFASQASTATLEGDPEYRVFLLGDSSVWGTLLTPEQTLSGQLNAQGLHLCGRPAHFYNLGYPTLSLTKDLLVLDESLRFRPDKFVWLTTLESFPREGQLASPILANNPDRAKELILRFSLDLEADDLAEPNWLDRTLIGQRRNLADLIRLQLYGVMWAATGVDQVYPAGYPRAQADLESDETFRGRTPPALEPNSLSLDVLDAGFRLAGGVPVLLVNEPILISTGANSDIRYNFLYPRWAYDQYRELLAGHARDNDWDYLDLWNLSPASSFTNTAIHLDAAAEHLLAEKIAATLADSSCQ